MAQHFSMNIQQATRQYESWLASHIRIVKRDLDAKHELMAQDAFSLLRATFYRWMQLFPALCPKPANAPTVLAVGDLHVENYGTWRDTEGRLIWGINDFDEVFPLPYTIDLVRLATSAWLAIELANCLQTMDSLPTVILKPGEPTALSRVIRGFMPAKFFASPRPAKATALRRWRTRPGQRPSPAIARRGLLQFKIKIHVRILAPERVEVNEKFFEERIRAALAVRQKHLPNATSFRVVNAESDFLSGLIVDKYEDVLVVQISSLGMDQRKAMIVAALQKIFSPRAILERSDIGSRKFEGLAESNGICPAN
jgi:hypothetical protein